MGGGCGRSALERHIPDSDQRACSRSYGKSQTLCKVPPSARQLAGEPQTASVHPSPNTPSKAFSLLPEREQVSPMCPVQSVTYVSGRSFTSNTLPIIFNLIHRL